MSVIRGREWFVPEEGQFLSSDDTIIRRVPNVSTSQGWVTFTAVDNVTGEAVIAGFGPMLMKYRSPEEDGISVFSNQILNILRFRLTACVNTPEDVLAVKSLAMIRADFAHAARLFLGKVPSEEMLVIDAVTDPQLVRERRVDLAHSLLLFPDWFKERPKGFPKNGWTQLLDAMASGWQVHCVEPYSETPPPF